MNYVFNAPGIDYAGLSPIIALTAGLVLIVFTAVFQPVKRLAKGIALITLATTAGLLIWQWNADTYLLNESLRIDGLAVVFSLLILAAAAGAVLLSIGDPSGSQVGHPDFLALLMGSVLGMVTLTQASNLITFFIALELFSIPLYALCGTNLRRRESLESGLKYLIVGSVGSATLLYGMALVYGASAATGFADIAAGLTEGGLLSDSLTLVGVGLISVGLAFKISIAPFHQWTPDVYQGAPTPVTAFMSAATKLAAFAVFIRFFLTALEPMVAEWDVILAVLATISILVGNVGAISQTSLKRMLGYSGIAQAGYMLAGIVVATQQGVDALTFYLAGYLAMNLAAFAAIVIHERQAGFSDSISSLRGIGRSNPIVAWPLTIAMLALAGLPPTVGFIGKLYLFQALVEADWTWLGVMIAIGTMISLVYYMRVVATIWMSPEPEASLQVDDEEIGADPDASRRWYLTAPAVIASAAAIFFGIIPQPLVEFAQHAGNALAAYIS
jgi:NADH-quinone oxidoreductase subunit N